MLALKPAPARPRGSNGSEIHYPPGGSEQLGSEVSVSACPSPHARGF